MKQDASNQFVKLDEILDKYESNPHKLIPILQEIQEEYKYLPEDAMVYIAGKMGIPASKIYGVATFYAHFTLEPKGKYVIKVCDGTACHVKKSESILEVLEKELGLNRKTGATADPLFTVETVACLGACGLAPAVVVNDKVHGLMTPESTVDLINEIKKEEEELANA